MRLDVRIPPHVQRQLDKGLVAAHVTYERNDDGSFTPTVNQWTRPGRAKVEEEPPAVIRGVRAETQGSLF